MKHIICILFLSMLALRLNAQSVDEVKPSTLAFHVFYNDFQTAQQIRNTSLGSVLSNNRWTNIANMQMGLGGNYLKGLNRHVDFIATLDGSYTDYLYKSGLTNGSSQFLLDANAAVNLKLLTDRHTLVPYLSAGLGASVYKGNFGAYIPVGIGLQVNLFEEAFIFTGMQYRKALGSTVNDHFQYAIGIGTSIGRKKKIKPTVVETIKPVDTVKTALPVAVKIIVKDIAVTVTDEQTGMPLPGANVVLATPEGNLTAITDASGGAVFNAVKAGDYSVKASLNGIDATSKALSKNDFDNAGENISVNLSHNDPRFTLRGIVSNKSTHQPEGGVVVNVSNTTQGIAVNQQNQQGDGSFKIQLEPGSDFTISGKKANFISNIEKVSTKGLNRSTTLYVKLELDIEEARPDKTITLKNIYYNTGSFKIRPRASSDLEKLVGFLTDNPEVKIEVASHTDSRGSNARNLKLSQARAQEVVIYLVKNGIAKTRLVPKGYGATRLVNGCKIGVKCTDAEHEQNRRTEFRVIGSE
jgi:outer membrane protein OmpA-like peptidoglycan-associated protein